ncbi:MAG: hypothetical protein HW421_2787 [Ignavibacteria bacterium]|nr:hypothetical protein [Ignavibacteria bacterium]
MKLKTYILTLFISCFILTFNEILAGDYTSLSGNDTSTYEKEASNIQGSKLLFSYGRNRIFNNWSTEIGISYELNLNKNISFNYRFAISSFNDVHNYHVNSGIIAGLYLLKNSLDDSGNDDNEDSDVSYYSKFAEIICFLLPEGINFHIPMNKSSELIAYINPLGYEFFDNEESLSYEIGIRLSTVIGSKFVIMPYIGYRAPYIGTYHGATLGVNVGIKF